MSTDTKADDIVTEEMEERAKRVFGSPNAIEAEQLIDALRAVAPMIAARARMEANEASFPEAQRLVSKAVANEREACAKIAEEHCTSDLVALVCGFIAAAIRARGETE
jgi:hypothetical protein